MKERGWSPDLSNMASFRRDFDEQRKSGAVSDMSDSAANAMWDLFLMEQQYSMDDSWWNEHDSPNAIYSQLRALGYSDAFISSYLLGQGSDSSLSQSPVVSGGSGDGALKNAIDAVGGMTDSANAVSRAIEAQSTSEVNQARANEANANANLANVNAGLRPSESAADVYQATTQGDFNQSNVGRNEHLNNLTDKEIEHIGSLIGVESSQAKFYDSQSYYYNGITDASIREMDAHVAAYYQDIRESKKRMDVMDKDIDLKDALADEADAHKNLYNAQTTGQDYANEITFADVQSLRERGVTLSMDLENKISELEAQGKFDEAEKLARGQFKYELYKRSGQYEGELFVPEDYQNNPSDYGGSRTPYGWIHGATRALNFGMGAYLTPLSAMPAVTNTGTPVSKTVVNPSKNYKPSNNQGFGRKWTDAEREAYFKRVHQGIK